MMGIGFPELMVILIIIMIIFGAGKLPEIGSAFGRSIKNCCWIVQNGLTS